eukprot:GGOE01006466.1.p1 GENE.GGOE01006466.1~~GGOE01006466.1.p1  ORF type:complete len:312 (-),score=85.75 GGOE01006466.1:1523-2332(-)
MFTKTAGHRTPEDKYNALWNGLRVRIGIHYGMGDVLYDEVSKGYDFYGTVVNAAARIEALAHGGQVVVSEELLDALPAPLNPGFAVATPLGTVPLRGVPHPPALVEFKPIALQARTFPPLRVDRANAEAEVEVPVLEDHNSHASESFGAHVGSAHSSGHQSSDHQLTALAAEDIARSHAMVRNGVLPMDVVTQQLLVLYHVIEDLLMPLSPQQFSTVVKVLAKGWGVSPPKTKSDFRASGLRLVQRMSETTKVFSHLSPLAQGPRNQVE